MHARTQPRTCALPYARTQGQQLSAPDRIHFDERGFTSAEGLDLLLLAGVNRDTPDATAAQRLVEGLAGPLAQTFGAIERICNSLGHIGVLHSRLTHSRRNLARYGECVRVNREAQNAYASGVSDVCGGMPDGHYLAPLRRNIEVVERAYQLQVIILTLHYT